MLTILIVDDQPSVLNALRQCFALESDFQIIGETSDGNTALVMAQELHPDIVLTDIRMPGMSGLAMAAALQALTSPPFVVFLTLYDDHATREQALAAGAAAFVSKHDSAEMLIDSLKQVGLTLGTQEPHNN